MKRIFGIKVLGTRIRIRKENKVRFGIGIYIVEHNSGSKFCVMMKLLTCFGFLCCA